MARYGTVRSFSFEGQTIWRNELRGHEAEGTKTLRYNVGLDVAIVIFQRHHETTIRFNHLRDHIIDETVFIPELVSLELWLILLVDLFKIVFGAAIIRFQDGVLC